MIFCYLLYAHSAQFVSLFHVVFQQKKQKPCITQVIHGFCLIWQGHKDLNPEPTVLETAALPIELYPYIHFKWWAFGDSNPGPTGYEPAALTN